MTPRAVILEFVRHPRRIRPSRIDSTFMAMALVVADPRSTPRHRLEMLRAFFRFFKVAEPSETISPKLARVWLTSLYALAFKADRRTSDLQSVHAARLLFEMEVWLCSHANGPLPEPMDMAAPFRERMGPESKSDIVNQVERSESRVA